MRKMTKMTKMTKRVKKPTGGGHNTAAVEAVRALAALGTPACAIREQLHLATVFVASVLHNKTVICAGCGQPFYPTNTKARWGSKECHYKSLRELGT
jgi:hypothetical protein